jgi:hypothetical protein
MAAPNSHRLQPGIPNLQKKCPAAAKAPGEVNTFYFWLESSFGAESGEHGKHTPELQHTASTVLIVRKIL